jgi:hypothetical protein
MLYTYETYRKDKRTSTTTNFHEFEKEFADSDVTLKGLVTDNRTNESTYILTTDDLLNWREKLERDEQWKPMKWEPLEEAGIVTKRKDAINPSHYKTYFGGSDIPDLQWLEAMQYTGKFKDPQNFKAAVEMQVRKYLDRLGGKDAEVQELKKAIWYLKFYTAYIAAGEKPIRIKDIDTILSK